MIDAIHRTEWQNYYEYIEEETVSQYHVVKGLNTILIPRSIFVETYLYSQISNKQFKNSNLKYLGEDSSKNDDISRRVVGMISGSLTASQFSSFISTYLLKDIDGQTTDEEGNTLFHIADVTTQLNTLNLPKDIINLIPYVKIQNSPQSSVQPTGSFIDKLVRTVVTIATMIANAIVAVANFIVNIASAVVDWCIKAIGSFVNALVNVIKAVVDAIVAVLNVLVDLVIGIATGILNAVINPIIDMIGMWVTELLAIITGGFQCNSPIDVIGEVATVHSALTQFVMMPILMLSIVINILTIIESVLHAFTLGLTTLAGFLAEHIASILFNMFAGVAIATIIVTVVTPTIDAIISFMGSSGGAFSFTEQVVSVVTSFLLYLKNVATFTASLVLGLFGLIFSTFGLIVGAEGFALFLFDMISAALIICSIMDMFSGGDEGIRNIFAPITSAINKVITVSCAAVVSMNIIAHGVGGAYEL